MGKYLVRRVLQFIPVFLGATVLIFFLVWAIPGDPIRALAGDRVLPEGVLQAIRAEYGLDQSLPAQYWNYLSGVFQGDFGTDFRGRPVADIMRQSLPVTVRLALFAFAFEVLVGIVAGVLAGIRKNGFADNLVLVSTLVVIAIPIFVLGFLAQLLLGVQFRWFPVSGMGGVWICAIITRVMDSRTWEK